MRYRVMEFGGWLLLALGLLLFYYCITLLDEGRVVECGPATFIAFMVFRGGMLIIKLAVAARLCADVRTLVPDVTAPKPAVPRRTGTPTWQP